jgi:tetratricopeptide (TPR) repeat protein
MPSASRAANVLFQAGDLARSSALSHAAREIDLEAVALAEGAGTAVDQAEALLRLAQNPGGASADAFVGRARSAIARVHDATVAARLTGEARWLEILARLEEGRQVETTELFEAAEWFSSRDDRTRAARALILAAEQCERSGRAQEALRTLDRAFDIMAGTQRVADDLSLTQAELARRVLEGWLRLAPSTEPQWGLDRVDRYLGAVHAGTDLPRRGELTSWMGSASDRGRTVVLVPRDGATDAWVIERHVARHIQLGALDSDSSLEPLIPLLSSADVVSFVPLWEAADIPLGAWVARQPSLAGVRAVRLRQRIESPPPRRDVGTASPTLSVGLSSPATDLPSLPFAEAEARAYAVHHRGWLLAGPDATEGHVVGLLPRAGVFYFAGHAVISADRFGRSALILHPQGGDGYLTAAEISQLDLSGLQVVVLSACSSGATKASRAYARSGLAQAFLRAGAGAVVGSLSDLPDAAAARAMAWIQPEIGKGTHPSEALLSLQRREGAGSLSHVVNALVVWVS